MTEPRKSKRSPKSSGAGKKSSYPARKREKIAISVDPATLRMVDGMVDGLTLRSRSQAIEYLVGKGLEQQSVRDAVLLARGAEAGVLLRQIDGRPLLSHHLAWLREHGIERAFLVTGPSAPLAEIEAITKEAPVLTRLVIEEQEKGTAPAIRLLRKELPRHFLVLLADTLNRFDLTKMILFHLRHDRVATVGLISSDTPEKYSSVELEGDRIAEFRRDSRASHVIDAGIYLFAPRIFGHLARRKFLDRDVFPQLCHTDEIKGYFTRGQYRHYGES